MLEGKLIHTDVCKIQEDIFKLNIIIELQVKENIRYKIFTVSTFRHGRWLINSIFLGTQQKIKVSQSVKLQYNYL